MNPNTQECLNCHAPLQPGDVFCPMCGTAVPPLQPQEPVAAQNFDTIPVVPPVSPAAQPARTVAAPSDATVAVSPVPPVAPVAPQPPVPPPPTQAGYQPWQPQAGAGPAAVPPAPPVPGAPPPAYGPPPPGGYPPAYGGYPPPAPPKKRNKALIAILCVAFVLLAAGGVALYMLYGPPAEARREAEIQDQYQTLMEAICKSASPNALAAHGGELDDFSEAHPDVVDADLKTLVQACDAYEYGDRDDEDTFTSMKRTLERLENSNISPVADCAAKLLVGVSEEYDAFVERVAAEEAAAAAAAAAAEEEEDPPEPAGPPASDPFQDPFPYELTSDFAGIDGIEYFYEYYNVGDKTIDYIDTWIFCYDENGNPIDGDPIEDGLANVEWTYSTPNADSGGIGPMESYEGVGDFSNCPNAVYALPFISFVRFTDGTYWGITDYTEDDGAYIADYYDVIEWMYEMKQDADEYALEVLSEAAA